MSSIRSRLCLLALCIFAALGSHALAIELGDPAPALQIAQWVKGQPIDLVAGKGKTVFVVEFWATWCGPCRVSIPHLTELQKKYKDKGVQFVGISDEAPGTVKPFVAKMADKMDYTVAVDNNGRTGKAYMEAFGVNGIPHAFIVDKQGRIVWSGHPAAGLDQAVQQVLDGTYDVAKTRKRALAEKKLEEFIEVATRGDDDARAEKLGMEVEAMDREIGGIEPGKPFSATEALRQIRFRKALDAYAQADERGEDAAKLEPLAKRVEELAPAGFNLADEMEQIRLRRICSDYLKAVGPEANREKAAALAKKLESTKVKAPSLLNDVAWTILTDERIKDRDVALALRLAKAAVDASGAKDPDMLDTYARALCDSGKIQDAITQQKKAVEACTDESIKAKLEQTLKEYQDKAAGKGPGSQVVR
jgi:thiol-disulfide isomerase/thioredoxin